METKMTSEDSFAILQEIEEAIKRFNESEDPNDWDRVEGLEKQRLAAVTNLIPEVGTKGTICYYSDMRAVTVVEVNEKGNKVGVRFNKINCLDYFGDRYEILPELEDYRDVQYFTKRRSGRWRAVGSEDKPGNIQLCIHFHRHSIDPTF